MTRWRSEGIQRFLDRLRYEGRNWELVPAYTAKVGRRRLIRARFPDEECPLEVAYGTDDPNTVARFEELTQSQARAVVRASDGETGGPWRTALLEVCKVP